MLTDLEKEIIKVIVYFDMFDYPLTLLEIRQYLAVPASITVIQNTLQNTNIQNIINNYQGFYFLTGRAAIITIRQERYNLTFGKIKKALRVSKIFRLLPWIKMISIANLIGSHNLRQHGDIDFFVVTTKDKLWLTRLFCVGWLKILGLRPTKDKTQDTICLSFFTTDDNLNLQPLMLQQEQNYPDRYFIYWLANIYPIYNQDQTYQALIKKNAWLNQALPNWQPLQTAKQRTLNTADKQLIKAIKQCLDFCLTPFATLAKQLQYKVMAKQLKDKMNQNTEVIINDNILKLHTTDRRQDYYQKYIIKLQQITDQA